MVTSNDRYTQAMKLCCVFFNLCISDSIEQKCISSNYPTPYECSTSQFVGELATGARYTELSDSDFVPMLGFDMSKGFFFHLCSFPKVLPQATLIYVLRDVFDNQSSIHRLNYC